MDYNDFLMKISKAVAGKWVAIHSGEIIGSSKKLQSLVKKIESQKGKKKVQYSLVPQGLVTGYAI